MIKHLAKKLVTLAILCSVLEVYAGQSITWIRIDLPPSYILHGDKAGTGSYELVVKFLASHLPQYTMLDRIMTRKRFWYELKRSNNYCDVGVQKTETRQLHAYYSTAMALLPPTLIVLNRNNWTLLGKPSAMSLHALLSNQQLRGAIVETRSYGAIVDEIVQPFEHNANSNIQRKVIKMPALFSMIGLARLNFTLDYEIVVNAFTQQNSNQNIAMVDIKEEKEFQILYIACTKNAWGKQVIADINPVLKQHRMSPAFRASFAAFGKPYNVDFFQKYYTQLEQQP